MPNRFFVAVLIAVTLSLAAASESSAQNFSHPVDTLDALSATPLGALPLPNSLGLGQSLYGDPDVIEYTPPTPPDVPADPTTTDAFKASPVTEQFETLRGYRNRLVDTVRTLTSQIQSENEQLKILQPNRRQLQDMLRFQTDSLPAKQTLITQASRIKDHLTALKSQTKPTSAVNQTLSRRNDLAVLQGVVPIDNEQQIYQPQLDSLEEIISNYDLRDSQLKQKKSDLQQRVQAAGALVSKVTELISRNIQTLNSVNNQLADADEKIANLFGKSDARNAFKSTMSKWFAGLVAIVIVGFFGVAIWDQSIRKSIFTNESGIQFITLFSLVIAIILFGIVEILEGKELAALLGGLSGYILGRGTAKAAPT